MFPGMIIWSGVVFSPLAIPHSFAIDCLRILLASYKHIWLGEHNIRESKSESDTKSRDKNRLWKQVNIPRKITTPDELPVKKKYSMIEKYYCVNDEEKQNILKNNESSCYCLNRYFSRQVSWMNWFLNDYIIMCVPCDIAFSLTHSRFFIKPPNAIFLVTLFNSIFSIKKKEKK